MAKPALGKGLDKLMGGDKIAGQNGSPPAPDQPSRLEPQPALGRGIETLIEKESPQPKPGLLPRWFYFAADLLLLLLTIAVCIAAPKPFSLGTILFCVLTVTFGAVLAIIGLRTSPSPR